MLFAALLFLASASAAQADRVTSLVEQMRQLTRQGDHRAVGRLAPVLAEELAKPHPNASIAWGEIGGYLATQGDYAEAERAYLRGLRLCERETRVAAKRTLLQVSLASAYLEAGRPALAESLCRRALKQAIELYGPESPDLAAIVYTLGAARQQQGRRKDARQYFLRALELAKDSSEGKVRQGLIHAYLGVISAQDKHWIEARNSLLQAVAELEPLLGPSHPELLRPHLNLARVYEHLKQWEAARTSAAKARAIAEERLGPEHPVMAEVLATTASMLRKAGHGREARDLDRRANAILKAQPKTGPPASIHIADLAPR